MAYPMRARYALLLGLITGVIPGLPGAFAQTVAGSPAQLAPLDRATALAALEHTSPQQRLAAVARLGAIGTMADADRLVSRLYDANVQVRQLTNTALWQIWSRSGDPGIGRLYQQGVAQMEASKLREAVATFTAIIARRPAFAEAWSKPRPTLNGRSRSTPTCRVCPRPSSSCSKSSKKSGATPFEKHAASDRIHWTWVLGIAAPERLVKKLVNDPPATLRVDTMQNLPSDFLS